MTLKKVTVFVLVFLFTLVFATSLHTPKTTEAMWIGGLMIELYCDECRGQWRKCCEKPCFDEYGSGVHTDEFDSNTYQSCLDSCSVNLAGICRIY